MLNLYNSLTKQIEELKPIHAGQVGFYSCGPTVYDYIHIGNLRTFLMTDILRRALELNGLKVKFVMNITDVGHLTSDGDTGDDKMEKNAKTVEDVNAVAQKYTDAFMQDINKLNIQPADEFPKASEHINEQIEMIQGLIDKGLAYESDDAIYFDINKFPDYTKLVGQNLNDMMLGARQEVVKDPNKHHPYDFVLWFKAVGRYAHHIMKWPSPWGEGFPGWHIECSAMSRKYLGQPFDIHAGGIDLKFPHHTNEIAQSQGFAGETFANYWVHGEHLLLTEGKMAKSEGNSITLQSVLDKQINPIAFRYLVLTTHYRSKLHFSWDSLTAAQNALHNIYSQISSLPKGGTVLDQYLDKFQEAINSDLDTPAAIAVLWDMLKSDSAPDDKLATVFKFDEVLGLSLKQIWDESQPLLEQAKERVTLRDKARAVKDYAKSDELRQELESQGFEVDDTPEGTKIRKKF